MDPLICTRPNDEPSDAAVMMPVQLTLDPEVFPVTERVDANDVVPATLKLVSVPWLVRLGCDAVNKVPVKPVALTFPALRLPVTAAV
eukprot:15811-Eustigmatos_ZCMA.PRE.1